MKRQTGHKSQGWGFESTRAPPPCEPDAGRVPSGSGSIRRDGDRSAREDDVADGTHNSQTLLLVLRALGLDKTERRSADPRRPRVPGGDDIRVVDGDAMGLKVSLGDTHTRSQILRKGRRGLMRGNTREAPRSSAFPGWSERGEASVRAPRCERRRIGRAPGSEERRWRSGGRRTEGLEQQRSGERQQTWREGMMVEERREVRQGTPSEESCCSSWTVR